MGGVFCFNEFTRIHAQPVFWLGVYLGCHCQTWRVWKAAFYIFRSRRATSKVRQSGG